MQTPTMIADFPVFCRSCTARRKGVCGALNATQLNFLNQHTSRRDLPAGAEIVADGSRATQCSNLVSGVVKLTKSTPDGRQQIVGLQFAPDFIGDPFSPVSAFGAEAAGPVRICSFTRPALETLIGQSPGLERRLHEQALRDLDDARDWMMALGRKTAREKVATFLLFIALRIDPNSDGPAASFDIPLKRAEIADLLGLSIETISRHLSELRKSGIIEIEKSRHLNVTDFIALRDAAGN